MKLESIVEAKKLRVFDFDDTLVISNSKVHVTQANGKKLKLTPAEWAVYNSKPGDEYDFHEFNKLIDPKEIKHMVKMFQNMVAHASAGHSRTEILTARASAAPVDRWLESMGIKKIPVKALADSDPQAKADYIERRIRDGFDDIKFYDDSRKNIRAVDALKKKHPRVKIYTQLVKV